MANARHLPGPDGIPVEVITLDGGNLTLTQAHHPDAHANQPWFLVTQRGRLVAYCRDIEEVADHVTLADLHAPTHAAEDSG